jgi:hypothetical protein
VVGVTTTTERRGLIADLPETDYHRDPDSLSVSGMKLLLDAPALFRYRQDHPEHKDVFDFGSAAHAKVLGIGAEIVAVDAEDWRGKAAREARDAAREDGKVALLRRDVEKVDAMAAALEADRDAHRLLLGCDGRSEVSAFWHDDEHGVTRRARFDRLRDDGGIVDYKTTANANPERLAKAVADFGYDMQQANYLDVAEGVGIDAPWFAFIFQAKEPPYLPVVAVLDESYVTRGRARCQRALDIYATCRDRGIWPGYPSPDGLHVLYPPRYLKD